MARTALVCDADADICGDLYDAAGQLYQHFFGDRPRGVNRAKTSECFYLMRPGLIPILDSRVVTLYRQASRTQSGCRP